MLKETNESPNKSDTELASRLHEAVALKNAGFFLTQGLLFIAVPEWKGWQYINHEKYGSMDHFARWECFFHPRDERLWVFLRITWPSLTQILLSFTYPDDRKLLEEIVSRRRLVLLDPPLLNGRLNPLSSGVIVDDIPVDVLEVFSIGFDHGKNTIH